MACAFGMEACKQYYTTKYVRLPDLLIDLEMAKVDEQKDIFELLHRRCKRSSTIFCSQYHKDGWYEQLGGASSPLADAILDRIVHDSYIINIQSLDPTKDISMREVYGLDKSLRE